MTLKKLFTGLISLAAAMFAVCAITVCAGADWMSDYCQTYGDYKYLSYDDGSAEIFAYTGNAKTLTIPSTIDGNKVTSIYNNAFSYCDSLTTVTIPDGVTYIKGGAFSECSNLVTVYLPKSVIELDSSIFEGCTSLKSVTIPDSVTVIPSKMFYNCLSLASIDIPKNVTTIGGNAFYGCSSLTSVNIPDSVISIGSNAFAYCQKLASIVIPDSLTSLYGNAFNNTPFLDKQTTSIKYAGKWAIGFDESITTASIKSGTKGIAESAFKNCDTLISVTIPDSVTIICGSAFSGCKSLKSVTIPDSVTIISGSAFSGCNSLKSVTIPDSVIEIGTDAFKDTLLLNNQTSNVKYVGKWAVSCAGKENSSWGGEKSTDSNQTTNDTDNVNMAVTIKAGTVGIADAAFYNCKSLSSVEIPVGVKYIGGRAFSYCSSLASIHLPDGVASIADRAFYYCSSLTSITIPDSVTCIGNIAFEYCSNLKDVYYPGSKAQWDKIAIDEDNEELLSATIHYDYGKVPAPSSVTGLKLKARAADALRIAWTKSTSADGYIIEMKSGSTWTRVGKITKNSTVEFRKAGLKAGTAYSFRVKAYKMSGKTALYGGNTTISARTNPSAVSGLKLKGRSGDALRISWTKNTSADGYIIEMKSGNSWTRVGKITKNSTVEFKKSKLKAGTVYTFRVKAYKMSGKTALYGATKTISVRTNPSAVSGLKLKASAEDAVRLSWTKNTSADGYIIEMKSGNSWVRVGKIAKNSTVEFKKSGLKSKTSYSFRIKAYKMSGKTALYGATKTITVKTK